jgi:hypothetical protein
VLALIGISATTLALESASFAGEVWQLYLGLGLVLGFGNASLGGVWTSSLLGRWFSPNALVSLSQWSGLPQASAARSSSRSPNT